MILDVDMEDKGMPKGWMALQKEEDRGMIIVNINQISSIEPDGDITIVWFLAGHVDGNVRVREKVETILELIERNS